MVFDYARVDAALSQPKNFLRSIGRSISFVSRRLGPSLRISYAVILSGVPVSLVYVFVSESLPQENTWGVLAAFLAQETFIFLIAFLRCWLYSSQTVFYRSTTTLDR
jgi:hypothetical protein